MARARLVAPAWLVAGALSLLFLWRVALPAATRPTHGFSAYYTAARLVLEGYDPARFYDDDWFREQTVRLGFAGAEDIYNVNPPTAALLLLPLAGLTPRVARAVWTGLNLLFLGLALAGLLRLTRGGALASAGGPAMLAGRDARRHRVGHDALTAAGALALLALFQPAREEVRLGQAYALLLLGEVALLWAFLARQERTAGLLLGLLLGVKTAGLLLPALLLARRRWRALGWTLLAVALVSGLSLPWLGPAAWRTYAGLLPGFGARPELAVSAYQDLPGLLWHLLRPDPRWNPAPVLAASRLAAALAIALPLALAAATFLVTWCADPRCRRADALAFAAWMTLTIILSPVSEDYHYTLLLVPIAILLAYWRAAGPGRPALIALALGVALIGAPLPYKDPALSAGAWALLAYPKLYGALALWAVALFALRRPAWRVAHVASATVPAPQPEAAR